MNPSRTPKQASKINVPLAVSKSRQKHGSCNERRDLTKRANTFFLSSGERAGVRASVSSNMSDIYNPNSLECEGPILAVPQFPL
jgi:hypothetical protein